jgi:hypothetical protein
MATNAKWQQLDDSRRGKQSLELQVSESQRWRLGGHGWPTDVLGG